MIRIYFKDPDGVDEAINEEAKRQVDALQGIDDSERSILLESRKDKISSLLNEWIQYGEYCMVEIDTEKGTARVVPTKEVK